MRILVTRHAEDTGEPDNPKERPLTEGGRGQALDLANLISHFNPTKIFSSTMQRSKETAAIISKSINVEYTALDILQEQMLGKDRPLEVEKLIENQGYVDLNEEFERGESYAQLVERCEKIKSWILNDFDPEERIVLVLHGKIMTFLLAVFLDYKPNGFFLVVENTSYYILDVSRDWRPQLVLPKPNQVYV